MKSIKTLSCIVVVGIAILLSGCDKRGSSDNPYAEAYDRANRDVNVFGVVKASPGSYARVPPTTIALHTDEILVRKNVTGNNVSFLAGLLTIADY